MSSGYGGSKTATRRFGGTVAVAAALGGTLSSLAGGAAPGARLDQALQGARSAQEIIEAIVEFVRPVDGTQDAEAARASIQDALSDLLTDFQDADLRNLTAEQRAFVVERFTAIDVYRRVHLDLGKTIVETAPSAATALSRMKDVRDYITESVAAAFRRLRTAGRSLTTGRITTIVRDALRDTFVVFEDYLA